jgi:hypothetical protein
MMYITRYQDSYNEVPPFNSFFYRLRTLFRLRLIALRFGLRNANKLSCIPLPDRSLNPVFFLFSHSLSLPSRSHLRNPDPTALHEERKSKVDFELG